MFFYNDEKPPVNSVAIAELILEEENDLCLYVTLPEYNNLRGIIPKSELARKKRYLHKNIKELKKKKIFPCLVSSISGDMADLTVKHLTKDITQGVMARHANLIRILKIICFISKEFKIDLSELMENYVYDHIEPISENISDVDDLSKMYGEILTDPKNLVDRLGLDNPEQNKTITDKLVSMVKYGDSDSSLDFQINVWQGENSVQILRDVFTLLKEQNYIEKIDYMGSPNYTMHIKGQDNDDCELKYTEIKNLIKSYLKENEIKRYNLVLDIKSFNIKRGDITISFPYEVNF